MKRTRGPEECREPKKLHVHTRVSLRLHSFLARTQSSRQTAKGARAPVSSSVHHDRWQADGRPELSAARQPPHARRARRYRRSPYLRDEDSARRELLLIKLAGEQVS